MSQITKEQLFKYLDEEKLGKIKKEEIPQALRYLGIIKTKSEIDFLVENLENEITYDRFISIIDEQLKTSLTKEQLINSFDCFDPKKTGKCSANELFHALKVVGEKLTDDDIKYIQSKIEIDKNGNIDYKNFVELLTQ
jgi:calmodulin